MNERGIRKQNMRAANVVRMSGPLQSISSYLLPEYGAISFIISGGMASQREEPLWPVMQAHMGVNPVLVLHKHNVYLERMVSQIWEDKCRDWGQKIDLCVINPAKPFLEPFFGMTPMQAVQCLQHMAEQKPYDASPAFGRVAQAPLDILRARGIPLSLTGLYDLTNIRDMGLFHSRVLSLPWGADEGRRVWAELGVDEAGGREQFDLFRQVVNNFAAEAMQNGWRPDTRPGGANFLEALRRQAVLLLDLNDMNADLLMSYLAEELRLSGARQFLLILDDVQISEPFADYLSRSDVSFGIVSENVVNDVRGEENLATLAELAQCIVLFKHRTGPTAEKLAELFGKYERTVRTRNTGANRFAFSVFNSGYQSGEQFAQEDSYRVRPEEIQGLGPKQAIILDALADRIIHYN